MGRNKEINKGCFININNSVNTPDNSCGGKLERATEGRTGMDRMAGRRQDNFIRWCHGCKHEVPDWILSDRCDWCDGDVVEIN